MTPKTDGKSKTKSADILSPASQPSLAQAACEAAAKVDEMVDAGETMMSARVSEVNNLPSLAAMADKHALSVVQTQELMLVPLLKDMRMTECDTMTKCEQKADDTFKHIVLTVDARAKTDDVPGSDTCIPRGRLALKALFDRDQCNNHNGVLLLSVAEVNAAWIIETLASTYAVTRQDTKFGPDQEGLALECKVELAGYPASVIHQWREQLNINACYRRQRAYEGMYIYKVLAKSESQAQLIMKKGLTLGSLGRFEIKPSAIAVNMETVLVYGLTGLESAIYLLQPAVAAALGVPISSIGFSPT